MYDLGKKWDRNQQKFPRNSSEFLHEEVLGDTLMPHIVIVAFFTSNMPYGESSEASLEPNSILIEEVPPRPELSPLSNSRILAVPYPPREIYNQM